MMKSYFDLNFNESGFEIIYPFSSFNGCTAEIWEWISNIILHFIGYVIIYPYWDES